RARWAFLGICRADQQNKNGARRNGAAHDSVKPHLGRLGSMFVQPASRSFRGLSSYFKRRGCALIGWIAALRQRLEFDVLGSPDNPRLVDMPPRLTSRAELFPAR